MNERLSFEREMQDLGLRETDVYQGFRSSLFRDDPDLLAVLNGRLRLGRAGDPQYPAPIKSRGDAVAKVQRALVELGYPLSTCGIDGRYGDETYSNVLNYKREYGILTDAGYLDGIIGQKTILHIDNALAERKTEIVVNVRDNSGRPFSSPTVTVRLRDPQSGKLLGEQPASSSRLTFFIDRTHGPAVRIDTDGDPRFWPWSGTSIQNDIQTEFESPTKGADNEIYAIVPILRDITNSKNDLVDAGMQTGRVPPSGNEVSCGYPPGTAPLPLLTILNNNPNACGAARLQTEKKPFKQQLDGTLRILSTTRTTASTDPPGLFLIWIPDRLSPNKTSKVVDFHVYFHPLIGADVSPELEYPLGRRRYMKSDGTEGIEQPYVGKGYQHLMWRTWGAYQHDLAGRSCVYVVPVGSRSLQFSRLTAAKLSDWLQEIASFVAESFVPQCTYIVNPTVGKVALSGWSFGGVWVGHVLSSIGGKKGDEFLKKNVGEVYLFDVPPLYAPSTSSKIAGWQNRGGRRIVRSYTQFAATYSAFVPRAQTNSSREQRVRFNGAPVDAVELISDRGSTLLIPNPLFTRNCSNQSKTCNIPIGTVAHEWFVRFFMAHALKQSWFDPL